jgi:ParB-like chromosome segregation protein Spo0J
VESIKHNRFCGAVTVRKSTSRIIAGKHRWLAARECGIDLVPVIWADVDDAEAARIMPADNRTTRLGFDDPAAG